MTTNEIKKALYIQKPDAFFEYIRKGNAYYKTNLLDVDGTEVIFEIPVTDMGEADFKRTMPAQELNRWILNN
jgi:hypothetical protein